MSRIAVVSLLATLFAVAALMVAAQQPSVGTLPPKETSQLQRPLTPMMAAIKDVFETEKKKVALLELRLKSASGEQEIIELIRQIERVRLEAEIEVLAIQASFARREGRVEQAERIEASIEKMKQGGPHAVQPPRIDRATSRQTQ